MGIRLFPERGVPGMLFFYFFARDPEINPQLVDFASEDSWCYYVSFEEQSGGKHNPRFILNQRLGRDHTPGHSSGIDGSCYYASFSRAAWPEIQLTDTTN